MSRDFVRAYYDWYRPMHNRTMREAAFAVALREKKEFLSDELYAALEADHDAQEQVVGDEVGLDYDPFLNAQDDVPTLKVAEVKRSGDAWRVTVRTQCTGQYCGTVAIAEVKPIRGQWRIVNIHRGDGKDDTHDLLSQLKHLAAERRKMPWDVMRIGGWWRVASARAHMTANSPPTTMAARGKVTLLMNTIDLLGVAGGPDSVRYTYTLDTLVSPRRILMTGTGSAAGAKWTGIYRISGDSLFLSLPIEHHNDRPLPPRDFTAANTLALILVRAP